MGTLKVGDTAPEFTLPDQTGKTHSLSDYRGKWALIYFYPRDNTPGCTVEACALRDEFSGFKKKGAVVLGVSADSVKSHEGFAKKFKKGKIAKIYEKVKPELHAGEVLSDIGS